MKNIIQHAAAPLNVRMGLVVSRWNAVVSDSLCQGAMQSLQRLGVPEANIQVIPVPGAFELPLACKALAQSKKYEGLVALGVILRGETPHFELIAEQCTNGIGKTSHKEMIPIGFGVLSCHTLEQALERAGGKHGNKGAEAAEAAVEMIHLMRLLKQQS